MIRSYMQFPGVPGLKGSISWLIVQGISFLWFSPLSFDNAVHLYPHPTLPPLPCSIFSCCACTLQSTHKHLFIPQTPSFSPLTLKLKSFIRLYKTSSSWLLVMSSVSVEIRNLEYTHTHAHTLSRLYMRTLPASSKQGFFLFLFFFFLKQILSLHSASTAGRRTFEEEWKGLTQEVCFESY